MSTATSLNLRAVLKTAVSRSGMDAPARIVSGLTTSAKALFVAAAAQAQPNAVVLYVVPNDGELEQACADVSFFLAALEGLTSTATDRAVLPFPSHEVDPYRGLAPHVGVTSVRARALYSIAHGAARVVVASAAALLPRVTPPARMLAASLDLRPGQDIATGDLADLLVDAGFTREDPADEQGEFAIRGGIVDIFPAGELHPVRLEFIGDTIETLRTYDPSTQRSIAPIDQIHIVPLRDILDGNREAALFDYLSQARASRIIVSERDEVEATAEKLFDQIGNSYNEALQRSERIAPPSELLAGLDDVQARLAQATALAELGLDDEPPPLAEDASNPGGPGAAAPQPPTPPVLRSLPSRAVRCQPVAELRGRIPDWVAEIRRLRDAGDTTLFVAATAGRAERTIELLKEYEVFAVPVERAEDARYAAVLVAVGGLSRGFRLPDAGLQIYAEADVFEEERRAPERRRAATKAFLSDLRDLKVGDF